MLLQPLVSLLFPPCCMACQNALPNRRPHNLCDHCYRMLEWQQGLRCTQCDLPMQHSCKHCAQSAPAFARLRAPFVYGGVIKACIHHGKFGKQAYVWPALAQLMLQDETLRNMAQAACAIVPVPLHMWRLWKRGYNQSHVLADSLSKDLQLPVWHVLKRQHHTLPQSRLSLAKRHTNMQQSFTYTQHISGTILLIDDVVTSGETAAQAAQTLLNAGATRVWVLAVARALPSALG